MVHVWLLHRLLRCKCTSYLCFKIGHDFAVTFVFIFAKCIHSYMLLGVNPGEKRVVASNKQESPANAKVTTRQTCYIGRNSLHRPPLRYAQQYQRNLYIVEKYFQCSTIPSPTVRVYLHSFSHCCLPNV